MLSYLFLAALWSPAGKELTSFLFCVVCFLVFPYGVLGQVWYLIVSIPDRCLLPHFVIYQCNPFGVPKIHGHILGEGGPGHFHCMNFFSIRVPAVKPSSISCHNTSESLMDWPCTLPEDLDLTQPFADDLACLGFRQILLTLPLEMPHSEASPATLVRRSFSASLSRRSIIPWLMTSAGQPGIGSSSKESRPRLNTANHFKFLLWNTLCYYHHHTHQPYADWFLWRLRPP